MSAADNDINGPSQPPTMSLVKWLSLSLLTVAMLAFAAAHVPGQAGIICRFAAMFGLVVGAIIGWLAEQGRAANHRHRLLFAAILGAVGFVGVTLESHRLYVARLKQSIDAGIGFNLLPPEMIDEMNQGRAKVIAIRSRFDVFLRYRIMENRLIGDHAYPGSAAAYFWAVEIFLAALLAAGTFHIFSRPPTQNSGSRL